MCGVGQWPVGMAWLPGLEEPLGWVGVSGGGRDAPSLGRDRGVLAMCPVACGPSAAISTV